MPSMVAIGATINQSLCAAIKNLELAAQGIVIVLSTKNNWMTVPNMLFHTRSSTYHFNPDYDLLAPQYLDHLPEGEVQARGQLDG